MVDSKLEDRLAYPFRNDCGAGLVGVRQQDREFLAAIARREIARPGNRAADGGPHASQAIVSGKMTVNVVESLELIDIDHDQPKFALVTPRAQMLLCKRLVERTAIGETGQAVLSRKCPQPTVGFLELVFHGLARRN